MPTRLETGQRTCTLVAALPGLAHALWSAKPRKHQSELLLCIFGWGLDGAGVQSLLTGGFCGLKTPAKRGAFASRLTASRRHFTRPNLAFQPSKELLYQHYSAETRAELETVENPPRHFFWPEFAGPSSKARLSPSDAKLPL